MVARCYQDDQGRLPRSRVSRLGDDLHRDRPVRAAPGEERRATHRAENLHPTQHCVAGGYQELLQRLASGETDRIKQGLLF